MSSEGRYTDCKWCGRSYEYDSNPHDIFNLLGGKKDKNYCSNRCKSEAQNSPSTSGGNKTGCLAFLIPIIGIGLYYLLH